MSLPLVSVIMPVHNAVRYVSDAVASILTQTYRHLELIIVDDTSTDGSGKVISMFTDPRLRQTRSETPLNAAGARNLGIKMARGGCIAFLDADDIAEPDRLRRQVEALKQVDVSASLIASMDEQGNPLGTGFVRKRTPAEIAPTLLFENCLALSSIMVRRSMLEPEPFRPGRAPAEDYDLWARLSTGASFQLIRKELTRYRVHDGGVSAQQPDRMQAAVADIHTEQLARLGLEPASIHARLTAWPPRPTMEELHEAERWLTTLQAANDQRRVYETEAFRREMARRWHQVCMDSWQLGWPVWKVFHRSPLARTGWLERARLLRRVVGK